MDKTYKMEHEQHLCIKAHCTNLKWCILCVCLLVCSVQCVDVIVVGAGLSGLAAARTLCNDGRFNITILEARPDRYGGRVCTDTVSMGVRK